MPVVLKVAIGIDELKDPSVSAPALIDVRGCYFADAEVTRPDLETVAVNRPSELLATARL